MTLIDTSAWIEFFRAKGDHGLKSQVADLIARGEAAHTCPVQFELLLGARPAELPDLHTGLGYSQRIVLLPAHWDIAAALGARLRATGQTLPASDLLIATVAHESAIPLLARDQHFKTIRQKLLPGLKLVS